MLSSARQVADGIAFPNGMAVTPDNSTLIVAESYGRKLTAFDIEADGGLSNRRVWADLGDGVPDGICLDAENAVWYADVPNKRCVRVREGGEVLQTINIDRGCFACMLGGSDRRTLLLVATEWRGPAGMTDGRRTGQLLTLMAPAAIGIAAAQVTHRAAAGIGIEHGTALGRHERDHTEATAGPGPEVQAKEQPTGRHETRGAPFRISLRRPQPQMA